MRQSLELESEKVYHIYNRANGNEKLFLNEEHYYLFLLKYGQYISPIVETLAYCLLPNHFHLMVKIKNYKSLSESLRLSESDITPQLISKQFGNLFSSYTQSFNKKYERKGSLFIPRFKRKEVTDSSYFTKLVAYIHTNPVKHGLVKDPIDWMFSSYHAYTSLKKSNVQTDLLIEFFGSQDELVKFHKNYTEYLIDMKGLEIE